MLALPEEERVGPNELAALVALRETSYSPGELALRIAALPRDAEGAVDRLVRRGLVERDNAGSVHITDAGLARIGAPHVMR
jgi:DNA-binding MarR family transcriptional regulator